MEGCRHLALLLLLLLLLLDAAQATPAVYHHIAAYDHQVAAVEMLESLLKGPMGWRLQTGGSRLLAVAAMPDSFQRQMALEDVQSILDAFGSA
eukprot:3288000-Rhodomonas_salina.2